MFTLHPDTYLTRRQRLHFIMDDTGELAWSGKTLLSAFEYLLAHGKFGFRMETPDGKERYLVQITTDLTDPPATD